MQEMFNTLMQENVSLKNLLGIMLFSTFLAFFHFMIISGIYQIKLKKTFFLVYPCLLLFVYFINPPLVYVIFIFLFISTFIMAIIGMLIVTPFLKAKERSDFREKQREISRKRNPNSVKEIPKKANWAGSGFKSLLATLFVIFCFLNFGILGVIISMVLIGFITNKVIGKTNPKKLQKDLPTSKINSVAMGLAEIKGKIKYDETIVSRLKSRKCAGYVYWIDEIYRDKDGDERFSRIYNDSIIKPFYLEDETGRIKVNPANLELLNFESQSYRSNGKKYTEYIIEENDIEYLMIGRVELEGNEPVMAYDANKKVLSIFPENYVSVYNYSDQVMVFLRPYFIAFLLWTSFILSSEINLTQKGISVVPNKYITEFLTLFKKNQQIPEETIDLEPVIIKNK